MQRLRDLSYIQETEQHARVLVT